VPDRNHVDPCGYQLRAMVFSELDAARVNGYFAPGEYLHSAGAAVIADDMVAMSPACEGSEPEQLLPYVQAWMMENGL
jgi:predicted house-cleaning NTP pyrophosphatase (Maf/HAM1 superfamily)